MTEESSKNKGIIVLKASIIVSVLVALAIGSHLTLVHGSSFPEFISAIYLAFINNLVMPVSIATIIYYLFINELSQKHALLTYLIRFLYLALLSLALLFIWNSLDIFFHFHRLAKTETFLNDLTDKFFMGLTLCFPIAVLVILTFRILGVEKN